MDIENHHLANTLSNNCFKQELSMEINICGWKHDEKKDVYIISKYFPMRCWLIAKEEIGTLQWEHLANTTLQHTGCGYRLIWCIEKSTISPLWCSGQNAQSEKTPAKPKLRDILQNKSGITTKYSMRCWSGPFCHKEHIGTLARWRLLSQNSFNVLMLITLFR